ncbi:unnamed protein product [Protopolystoma xenopodis]|uniref:Carboxypeptidase regulatory-like domain-containing protein n=1 Tax=Protopolystoma xenopodis TaxID=117903 RepID=A0A448WZQ3_9PLAT|nr:unnamed protein product [Protopolystoma xenopodis]
MYIQTTNGAPVPWARIHIDYLSGELSTGPPSELGFFGLPLPPGVYRLTVMASGFLDQTRIVRVRAEEGVTLVRFRLTNLVTARDARRQSFIIGVVGMLILASSVLHSLDCEFLPKQTLRNIHLVIINLHLTQASSHILGYLVLMHKVLKTSDIRVFLPEHKLEYEELNRFPTAPANALRDS